MLTVNRIPQPHLFPDRIERLHETQSLIKTPNRTFSQSFLKTFVNMPDFMLVAPAGLFFNGDDGPRCDNIGVVLNGCGGFVKPICQSDTSLGSKNVSIGFQIGGEGRKKISCHAILIMKDH